MKVYKFRQLISGTDFCRLKEIVETRKFKCSKFQDLNDPMEGIFSILIKPENINYNKKIQKIIKAVYSEKMKHKICSFSGKKGFKNPSMWGYYAGGFKGVAIEIEVDQSNLKEVDCKNEDFWIDNKKISIDAEDNIFINDICIEEILTVKKKAWEHENEWRFLIKEGNDFEKVGEIKAVYFGDPYGNIENKDEVKMKNGKFKKYECFKEEIIKIVKEENIKCFNAKIINGEVKKGIKL